MKKTLILLISAMLLAGCVPTEPQIPENTAEPVSSEAPCITEKPTVDRSSLSTETIAWGFVRNKNAAPDIPKEWAELLERYDGRYLGSSEKKKIYLTFDEGYENGYTSKILDVLESCGIKAIFFVTAPYLEGQPELIERMIKDGHYIGNHTVHHPNLSKCSEQEIRDELGALNAKCEEKYGVSMQFMRPPEGSFNELTLAVAQDMGYKTVLWSHAYKDWDVDLQRGSEYAVEQVVPYTHNGEVLLLHAVSKDNAAALEEMINKIREMGFEFGDPCEL
ncbi:MAG: polysaccharide deacetylase family protein [Clostridiales bacterium]|nr:polysaccharide deacetylase family protein [Clostridiales bacterium]